MKAELIKMKLWYKKFFLIGLSQVIKETNAAFSFYNKAKLCININTLHNND